MIHYTCDMCGQEMCPDELRYVVSMDVCVAQDPLECSCDDDDVDHLEELTEIIALAAFGVYLVILAGGLKVEVDSVFKQALEG